MMNRIRILIADDHALVREGLLATLKNLGAETRTFGVADANGVLVGAQPTGIAGFHYYFF